MDSDSPTRPYRSALREGQARETRTRVIHAAATVFSRLGFQAATIAAIAREAGVSPETVKATASKSELLIAAFEVSFAGAEGEESLSETPVGEGVLDIEGPAVADAVIERIALANERGHALWTVLLGAALSDEGVDAALQLILSRRGDDYRMFVGELAARGVPVADVEAAATELSFLLSPEGYQQLVVQSGWPRERYVQWMGDQVRRVVAGPPTL